MISVRCLFFGVLRDAVAADERPQSLPDHATLADLEQALVQQYPLLEKQIALRAVNQEYVEPDYPLQDGDEVALMAPVSGG